MKIQINYTYSYHKIPINIKNGFVLEQDNWADEFDEIQEIGVEV